MQPETLEQFKKRIYSFEYHSLFPDSSGNFCTNSNLRHKVNENGTMKPYPGNTVVFVLQKKESGWESGRNDYENAGREKEAFLAHLTWIQEILYSRCQNMLAVRLKRDTFHMTLHDLVNGTPNTRDRDAMNFAGQKAKKMLEQRKRESWAIQMRTTCAFNMVNTSIVLGLEPVREEDCRLLMQLYEQMEEIVPLGYPMTPHITLAYYKPGIYGADSIENLEKAFRAVSEETYPVTWTAEDLVYQEFCDMNQYHSQP